MKTCLAKKIAFCFLLIATGIQFCWGQLKTPTKTPTKTPNTTIPVTKPPVTGTSTPKTPTTGTSTPEKSSTGATQNTQSQNSIKVATINRAKSSIKLNQLKYNSKTPVPYNEFKAISFTKKATTDPGKVFLKLPTLTKNYKLNSEALKNKPDSISLKEYLEGINVMEKILNARGYSLRTMPSKIEIAVLPTGITNKKIILPKDKAGFTSTKISKTDFTKSFLFNSKSTNDNTLQTNQANITRQIVTPITRIQDAINDTRDKLFKLQSPDSVIQHKEWSFDNSVPFSDKLVGEELKAKANFAYYVRSNAEPVIAGFVNDSGLIKTTDGSPLALRGALNESSVTKTKSKFSMGLLLDLRVKMPTFMSNLITEDINSRSVIRQLEPSVADAIPLDVYTWVDQTLKTTVANSEYVIYSLQANFTARSNSAENHSYDTKVIVKNQTIIDDHVNNNPADVIPYQKRQTVPINDKVASLEFELELGQHDGRIFTTFLPFDIFWGFEGGANFNVTMTRKGVNGEMGPTLSHAFTVQKPLIPTWAGGNFIDVGIGMRITTVALDLNLGANAGFEFRPEGAVLVNHASFVPTLRFLNGDFFWYYRVPWCNCFTTITDPNSLACIDPQKINQCWELKNIQTSFFTTPDLLKVDLGIGNYVNLDLSKSLSSDWNN